METITPITVDGEGAISITQPATVIKRSDFEATITSLQSKRADDLDYADQQKRSYDAALAIVADDDAELAKLQNYLAQCPVDVQADQAVVDPQPVEMEPEQLAG